MQPMPASDPAGGCRYAHWDAYTSRAMHEDPQHRCYRARQGAKWTFVYTGFRTPRPVGVAEGYVYPIREGVAVVLPKSVLFAVQQSGTSWAGASSL